MGQKNVACCDNQKEIFDEEGKKKKGSILAFFGGKLIVTQFQPIIIEEMG